MSIRIALRSTGIGEFTEVARQFVAFREGGWFF
jgi:hypothetical protein